MRESAEINSVKWVLKELDSDFEVIQKNLEKYSENNGLVEKLKENAELLNKAHGTLIMIEQFGAALVVEEISELNKGLLDGSLPNPSDSLEVFMLSILKFPGFLTRLRAGSQAIPIMLLPIINDIRAVRNKKLLSENVLFFPEIHDPKTSEINYSENLAKVALRQRIKFLRALLNWYQGKNVISNLKQVGDVLRTLKEHASAPASVRIWLFSEAIILSLIDRSLESTVSVKVLIAQIERLFKPLIQGGEEKLESQVTSSLQKNLLFYVARSASKNEQVIELQEKYQLADLLPRDEVLDTAQETLAGPSLPLLQIVTIGVKEDIAKIKDLIKAYSNGIAEDEDIKNILAYLEKVSDTLGMLGMEPSRQDIAEQKAHFNKLINLQGNEVVEQYLLDLASELLKIEDSLDEYVSSYHDGLNGRGTLESYSAEYRALLFPVIKESIKNFDKSKVAILAFLEDENNQELVEVPSLLKEVAGAMFIEPLDKVAPYILDLSEYIQEELVNKKRVLSGQEQDILADTLVRVEYFLEAVEESKSSKAYILGLAKEAATILGHTKEASKRLSVDSDDKKEIEEHILDADQERNNVDADSETNDTTLNESLGNDKQINKVLDEKGDEEDILDTFKKSKTELEGLSKKATIETNNKDNLDNLPEETLLEVVEEVSLDEIKTENIIEIKDGQVSEKTVSDDGIEKKSKYSIIGDDTDPEILKIFIEECLEELDNINQSLNNIRNNDEVSEAFTVMRRSFHTLKGGGRLLGAELISEFSWAHESIMNKVLEDSSLMDNEIVGLFEQAAAVLPQLISQLDGNQEPVKGIEEAIENAFKRCENLGSETDEKQKDIEKEQEGELKSEPKTESDVDGNESLLVQQDPEPFEIFGKEIQTHIDAIRSLISNENKIEVSDELVKALYALNSSAQSAGISQISSISAELESIVKLKQEYKQPYETNDVKLLLDSIDSIPEILTRLKKKSKLDYDVSGIVSRLSKEKQSLTDQTKIQLSKQDLELFDIFIEEADEILDSLGEQQKNWQANPDNKKIVKAIQREIHTLKGGARMAEFSPIADLSHALESLLVKVLGNEISKTSELFEVVQDSIDGLTVMLEEAKKRTKISEIRWLLEDINHLMEYNPDENIAYLEEDLEYQEKNKKKLDSDEKYNNDVEQIKDVIVAKGINEDIKELLDDKPKQKRENLRVSVDKIDDLINYVGEVNIYHARLGQQMKDYDFNLSELDSTIIRLREQLRRMHSQTEEQVRFQIEQESQNEVLDDFDPLEMDKYSQIQQLSKSLLESVSDIESIRTILGDLSKTSEVLLSQQARVGSVLQKGLMETRMVKFSTLLGRITRIVRQTASETGKKVRLVLDGENTEIDRSLQEKIIAPLDHLLRNAVSHGVESPNDRKESNKSEQGEVFISVKREGGDFLFNIKDDGRGLDLNAIKEKALQLNMISKKQNLSDNDIVQLIFHSGLSTANQVSQISGRGVGMNVVSNDIKALGGSFSVSTRKGQGTTFSIRIPLSLAITQALLVSTEVDSYAIPLAGIVGVSLVPTSKLLDAYNGNIKLKYAEDEYSLQYLDSLINAKDAKLSKDINVYPVLFLKTVDLNIALHVDFLLGRREVVVKPVGSQIGTLPGVTGATIMADGEVVLILDIGGLYRSYRSSEIVANATNYERAKIEDHSDFTVMVVDDSITIRKVTIKILERYKINTITAKDGIEAVALLSEYKPDLMLLDIEMPKMDGFDVASYIKSTPELNYLPIIMITSRTGEKHRKRAKELGVTHFLGKPYQENELLHYISDLLNSDDLRRIIND